MKNKLKLLSLMICILIVSISVIGCNKKHTETISFLNYGENIDNETLKEFEIEYGI